METLLERRARLLGPGLRQFYDFPFHPVRGQGAWLFDAEGRAYLDAYNNVPHVGHCHPHVVAALHRQAETVNTNTRYLHETILDYAEKLTGTLPPELSVCLFTCTGTEANDLAWRLATAYTGGDGAVATRYAYHGNSTMVIALDGAIRPGIEPRNPSWVKRVEAPGTLAGRALADWHDDGTAYGGEVEAALADLRAAGHRPAAFFFCSIFASDGLVIPPSGFMRETVDRVQRAGAVCIADEVQPGLGRMGSHMWGFQSLGIVPDIVTMGKPMGNGHPIGVVVAKPEIVKAFFQKERYFNTFGGNPVSCAAGLAVLEVVEREALLDNARQVGAYLKTALQSLAGRHEVLGDVRGSGLFLGVEVVAKQAPAPKEARSIMNELGRKGILVGLTGAHGSILKIRPPMVFSRANADLLLEKLESIVSGG